MRDAKLILRVIGFVLLFVALVPLAATSIDVRLELGMRAIELLDELEELRRRVERDE